MISLGAALDRRASLLVEPRLGTVHSDLRVAQAPSGKGATIRRDRRSFELQPHTVSGVLAGAREQKLSLVVTSQQADSGERVYRID
jgi:hypothetical protein